MLVLKIKQHKGGQCEFTHYFNETFSGATRKKLETFLQLKTEAAKPHDNVTWDYAAYKFAAEKIGQFTETGVKHTLDWSLTLEPFTFEKLPC